MSLCRLYSLLHKDDRGMRLIELSCPGEVTVALHAEPLPDAHRCPTVRRKFRNDSSLA